MTDNRPMSSAEALVIAKPNAGLGIAGALIAGSAAGDLASHRELRNAYRRLSHDNSRPLAQLTGSAECEVMMARLAASHGDLEDALDLADALIRSSDLYELTGVLPLAQVRLIEGVGLYKRVASTGHEIADQCFQRIAAAMPASVMERVMEEDRQLAAQSDGNVAVDSVRIH